MKKKTAKRNVFVALLGEYRRLIEDLETVAESRDALERLMSDSEHFFRMLR